MSRSRDHSFKTSQAVQRRRAEIHCRIAENNRVIPDFGDRNLFVIDYPYGMRFLKATLVILSALSLAMPAVMASLVPGAPDVLRLCRQGDLDAAMKQSAAHIKAHDRNSNVWEKVYLEIRDPWRTDPSERDLPFLCARVNFLLGATADARKILESEVSRKMRDDEVGQNPQRWRALADIAVMSADFKLAEQLLRKEKSNASSLLILKSAARKPMSPKERIQFANRYFDSTTAIQFLRQNIHPNTAPADRKALLLAIFSVQQTTEDHDLYETASALLPFARQDSAAASAIGQAVGAASNDIHYGYKSQTIPFLENVSRNLSDTTYGVEAKLALASQARRNKQVSKEYELLSEALKMSQALPAKIRPTVKNNLIARAGILLGECELAKQEYARALTLFEKYEPLQRFEGCGNAISEMQCERDCHIAECLVGLGKSKEAIDTRLMPYLTGKLRCDSTRVPSLLVRIFEQQKELPALITKARAVHSPLGDMTARLAEIRLWRAQGKVDKLISQLSDDREVEPNVSYPNDREDWRQIAAIKALSETGSQGFAQMKKRVEHLMSGRTPSGEMPWLLYAIGMTSSPEVTPFLKALYARAENDEIQYPSADMIRPALWMRTGERERFDNEKAVERFIRLDGM